MIKELSEVLTQKYKYGFQTEVLKESFPKGINEEVIKFLSEKKAEPQFLKKYRLQAFRKWKTFNFPTWANLDISSIDYQNITYYSTPTKKSNVNSLEEIDPKILETFEKLGINLTEQKRLANIAIDAVFDSLSVITTYKEKLAQCGVIFCSISEAIEYYPSLVEKFLGSVVSSGDNFFAALNSSVFSDGSFCYVPKNTICPLDLSTYFRLNDEEAGQFERTLIVAEENSQINYLEGCTAPEFKKNQLHAAVVEIIVFDNAKVSYSTVQNWYAGDDKGEGGVYNFVTKRALCLGEKAQVSWTQVETGSSITWKYPSCLLLGYSSSGDFSSIALTNFKQQADTGTKMLHLGSHTKSKILSKGISSGSSANVYRGLVKISSNAHFSRNFSQCDSFLVSSLSRASTYPYLDVFNSSSLVEHEAKVSKISEDQLFYLQQRGITGEQAISLVVNGFCKEVITLLPLEFASEAEKLLTLKLEGSVG